MQVGLSISQDDLPGNSDSVEEVVDEAHIIDEGVHVTGAQHKQGGQALRKKKEKERRVRKQDACGLYAASVFM